MGHEQEEDFQSLAYSVFHNRAFSYDRRMEWEIYGAKHRVCEVCKAPPYEACKNMADVKMQNNHPHQAINIRVNKKPHASRIDWRRVAEGLEARGYLGG